MVWQAYAGGAALGMMGASKDRDMASNMRHARQRAIKNQIKMWKQAYSKSQGQFEAERQGILGREQSQLGGVTAGMAGSGLLGTTVGANMARGVRSDTNRSLLDVASKKAATEYGQWMDLASIKGQTKWDGITPQSSAGAYGMAGAYGGQALGEIDWAGMFGGGDDKEKPLGYGGYGGHE
jgi:hypothetical protein